MRGQTSRSRSLFILHRFQDSIKLLTRTVMDLNFTASLRTLDFDTRGPVSGEFLTQRVKPRLDRISGIVLGISACVWIGGLAFFEGVNQGFGLPDTKMFFYNLG